MRLVEWSVGLRVVYGLVRPYAAKHLQAFDCAIRSVHKESSVKQSQEWGAVATNSYGRGKSYECDTSDNKG